MRKRKKGLPPSLQKSEYVKICSHLAVPPPSTKMEANKRQRLYIIPVVTFVSLVSFVVIVPEPPD